MTVTLDQPANSVPEVVLSSLALEITGSCQARCGHCYNESGPSRSHGEMSRQDWLHVLDQAADLGVRNVQYIGGEPTLHPYLADLVAGALDRGMDVEVFSNLIHVRPALWPLFERGGVNLATSYYSNRAEEHERITKGRGSYRRTKANIAEAVRRGIPIRAALVHVLADQRVDEAQAELRRLGVREVRVDRVRALGRAAAEAQENDVSQLCGRCTRGRAAVLPTGDVSGCVMSRWMTAGNVRHEPLAQILTSPRWRSIERKVPTRARSGALAAVDCNPNLDGEDCAPAEEEACEPSY